jgi:hypothetical protein
MLTGEYFVKRGNRQRGDRTVHESTDLGEARAMAGRMAASTGDTYYVVDGSGMPVGGIAPMVHLNGTSRDELESQLAKAEGAVRLAIDAVAECSPNARDYYPLGDTAFPMARDQHRSRLQRLEAVRAELLEIFEAVSQ